MSYFSFSYIVTARSYLTNELQYAASFKTQRRLRSAASLSLTVHCMPLYCQQSVLPCCRCPYLGQSTLACHVHTLCLFSEHTSRLFSSGIPSHDSLLELFSAWTLKFWGRWSPLSLFRQVHLRERHSDFKPDWMASPGRQRRV